MRAFGDDVGPLGQDFLLGNGEAGLFQIILNVIGHGGLTVSTRAAVRIDTGDADESLKQSDDVAWHGSVIASIRPKGAKKNYLESGFSGIAMSVCTAILIRS